MNIDRANFDGILGIGRKYLTNTKKYSILDTIKTNGAIGLDEMVKAITIAIEIIKKHED